MEKVYCIAPKKCSEGEVRSHQNIGLSKSALAQAASDSAEIGGHGYVQRCMETIRFKPGGVLMQKYCLSWYDATACSAGIGQNCSFTAASSFQRNFHDSQPRRRGHLRARSGWAAGAGRCSAAWMYAENDSDSWAPLAADLMKDYTVVVPDLLGHWSFVEAREWV